MRDGFASHTATGALGGAIGTYLLTKGMKMSRNLPERLKPPEVRRDPGDFVITKAEELRGQPLPQGVHDTLAQSLHWIYGISAGATLGLVTAQREVRSVGQAMSFGSAMGTAVWAVGYIGILPALKLTPPIHRQGLSHVATALVSHIAFGVIAALPLLAVDRLRTKRSRWRSLSRIAAKLKVLG